MGLAIAFVRFPRQRASLISEVFRTSLADRLEIVLRHAIKVIAVVSTVFGVATTVGLETLQIN